MGGKFFRNPNLLLESQILTFKVKFSEDSTELEFEEKIFLDRLKTKQIAISCLCTGKKAAKN